VKTYGALYVGTLEYYHRKPLPIVEKGWTQEANYPFRKGKCLVFRVPFTKPGFYLGKWTKGSELMHEDDDLITERLSSILSTREMGEKSSTIRGW